MRNIITLHNGRPVSIEKLRMLCGVWERQHDLPDGAFQDWINSGSETSALAIQNFSNFELVVVEEVAA